MHRFERKAVFARLEAMKRAGVPIIGGGAGTGLPTETAMTEQTRKFKAFAFG